MAKTFRTQGAGSQQTLHEIEDEKIPVYDTKADAEADLANLAEEQIVATKDTSNDYESELYNYVDAKLATTEVDVPITGVSLTCKARKSGNTVTVEFIASGSDLIVPHSAFATIGTLPAGYRPARLEEFTIGARVVSSTDNVATYPPRVTFGTDGNISIRDWNPSADVTLNSPYNTYTFLVDGSNNNFMSVNTLKDAKDYTDARAVRKYDYTMTGTTNVQADIRALCNQLKTLGDGTYSGEFFRTGQTSGHYSISIKTTANAFLNGIVQLGLDGNTSSTWSVVALNDVYNIRDNVINRNMVVATPATNPGSFRNQILYALNNVDWTFLTNRGLQSATGRIELSGYWWFQYTVSHIGGNYMLLTGTVDCENIPITVSAYYNASTSAWNIATSSNYTYVDISSNPGTNMPERITSALNTAAFQNNYASHDEGLLEVLGYFYISYTYDNRAGVAAMRGVTISSDPNQNMVEFVAECQNPSTGMWTVHTTGPIRETTATAVTLDGNACVAASLAGVPDYAQILSVKGWSQDAQGQRTGDWMCMPATNSWGVWYIHVEGWGGTPIPNQQIYIQVRYRIVS